MLQEVAHRAASQVSEPGFVSLVIKGVHGLEFGAEILSALLIGAGIARAAVHLLQMFTPGRRVITYHQVRLNLSRYLALALEFQLAADILGTTVEPSWEQLGKLGVIAVIRTFLNYFLAREIEEEERTYRAITGATATG